MTFTHVSKPCQLQVSVKPDRKTVQKKALTPLGEGECQGSQHHCQEQILGACPLVYPFNMKRLWKEYGNNSLKSLNEDLQKHTSF
mgnify:FL=1